MLAGAIACDKSPVAPSEQQQKVSLQALAIGGLQALQHPGEALQLSATATFSDGSTRDVTAEVRWASRDTRVVAIRPGGQLTATGYGRTIVDAFHPAGGPSARADARVLPEGMFLVSGVVREGPFELPDVEVSITLPDTTLIRATTDASGSYRLPGQGDVVVRAEKAGYSREEKTATVDRDIAVLFELDRLQDAGSIAGTYTLVFTASSSCTTLPAEVLRRQYTARIYEPKTLWVELVGADMEAWGWAGFTGTRDGSSVHFDIDDSYSIVDDDWVFVERLDPQRNLAFSGVATGTIEEDAIIATFDGRVQLRSVSGFPPTVFAECKAADHRLEFARAQPARRR